MRPVAHSVSMDTIATSPDHGPTYTLWHIPSSTLLLTSSSREAVLRGLLGALADGIALDDLMLQVTRPGSLVGRQYLGRHIAEAMILPDGPSGTAFATA